MDHSNHEHHKSELETSRNPKSGEHQGSEIGRVQRTGEHKAHIDHTGHEETFRRKFWVSLLLSIPVLVFSPLIQEMLGYSIPYFAGSRWIAPFFSILVFVFGGLPFLQMAVPEIQNRKPGMMVLISLAISVAFVYSLAALSMSDAMSFFWELVALIDIMLLGHWIEMRSVRQASGALGELARLLPDEAERIRDDGSHEIIPLQEVRSGDLLLVRPGSSIPVDGEVLEGQTQVNEAMITGESRPVDKKAGDRLIAGTLNGSGSLRILVLSTGEETTLAGIMRLVEQAQKSKSNTQILADKAAGWLFYIALGVAGVTAIAWIIAIGFNAQVVERVATVLVIACPHALGLAIPLVVAITTSLGARNGILLRDRLALERARLVDLVVFDKTGTLTRGEFGVAGIETNNGWQEEEALSMAAAVEGDSEHALGHAIHRSAVERGLHLPETQDFQAIEGRGVRAMLDGNELFVGGPRLLELLELDIPQQMISFKQNASDHGQSVVYLVRQSGELEVVAAFALADIIRPESRKTVRRLNELGIEVAMLTGDSQAVASSVAKDLGIKTFFAEVLPEHKEHRIADLQAQGRQVAMVGDGVNDAPALTRADVGIAIGSGTDVAIESAGVILVRDDPGDVIKVFELSRASYRKMVQNLVWASGYNLVALPLAAGLLAPVGILLSPAAGALLMSLSTVIVAINAQLLRRLRFSD